MNTHFTQLRWLAAMIMLMAAMVMPSTAWADGSITPSKPKTGDGSAGSPYQISNKEELYWFAGLVNGDASVCNDVVNQNTAACAKLMNDIVVNYDDDFSNHNWSSISRSNWFFWTPIGKQDFNIYTGTFDGQGHTISGLYFESCSGYYDQNSKYYDYENRDHLSFGLFGFNSGTIKNVGVINSYFGWQYNLIGGICGENSGTIENCYNEGKVEGKGNDTGGICARNFGTITNCYNLGTVIGEYGTGGVCGDIYDDRTITNCYYLSGTATGGINGADVEGSAESKTADQFKSGEVAWLLNGKKSEGTGGNPLAWYQNIGGDPYPVLDSSHRTVYRGYKDCLNITYSNNQEELSENPVHRYNNGICEACGAYQPATQNSGKYEIGNAGQLYWFAALVNGTDGLTQNLSANAVLTANITVNDGVLDASGNLSSNTSGFRVWTPIVGSSYPNYYAGTFDGQNHTVSGLYFNDSSVDNVGLFGAIGSSGKISNVGVVDSYFCGNNNIGGVCGAKYGTMENCYSASTVSGKNAVGGVCGNNYDGNLLNCYNTGAVIGTGWYIGGVCGIVNSGTIQNCYSTGTVGGSSDPSVGGVIGSNSGTITNCYYLIGTATGGINGADAAGSAEGKAEEQFKSGSVCYLLNESKSAGAWGQTLSGTGKQDYPVLGGMPVYYRAEVYANTYGILTEGTQTITASSSPYVWYEFTPEASATYLFVAPANVALVKEDISGVATSSSCVAKELVAETTYYVCIPGAPTPQADLTIKRIEAADTLLKVGTNTAYITSPDALWYAFTPAETGYYQFSSTDIMGSICVNTEKVMTGIMQGITTSPIYSLNAKTTYYVCFSYAPGEYDLTIAKLNTTLQLGADNAIMVSVSTSEPIWYEFTPTETGTYQFSSTDIKGSICVNTTKTDDDKQNITTSPTYSLSAGITYYVYVNYNPGEYKLTITKLSTTTALEAVVVPQIYAVDGRIVCEGEFRIYDLLGRDVTRLNGSLCGVYVVKTTDAAQKVIVK